jgi:bifunctional non-homologous end joining protein LigD
MTTTLSQRKPTRDFHPARRSKSASAAKKPGRTRAALGVRSKTKRAPQAEIPDQGDRVTVSIAGQTLTLSHLDKIFWPQEKITKGDLLRYYTAIAPVLLPHLIDRAMVMKRYPHGVGGEFFFMKRAPSPRPDWIETCSIEHRSGNVIDFPIVRDLASLLWIINLGCIDLNPWYARCDDVDRPDYLHFDLDPVPGADFERVRETAFIVKDELTQLGMKPLIKTTGSRGLHVYVPIVRGPTQKQVWTFAKQLAQTLAAAHPKVITAEYRVAHRPRGRVLVDYNQNAWGRTLASVYSVRPKPRATVSAPLTWQELEQGAAIEDFRLDNMPSRVKKVGDLWKPLLAARGRFKLEAVLHG